jgi:3-isopropylmalate/(R)-2-methylmalate dehydratase small subunit
MLIQGRVWKFGDNIDTDLMMPHSGFDRTLEEQAKWVFRANRPGWADQVKKGDIIVAGKNFGTGASRPAARLFRMLGIEAVVADSVNGLFFRNCINYGLPAFNCPAVAAQFDEGDIAQIDARAGTIKSPKTGLSLQSGALPDLLMRIIEAGGMHEMLAKEGLIEPLQR